MGIIAFLKWVWSPNLIFMTHLAYHMWSMRRSRSNNLAILVKGKNHLSCVFEKICIPLTSMFLIRKRKKMFLIKYGPGVLSIYLNLKFEER